MRLELDKTNAALFGVCAGLARAADVDPVLVRIAVMLTSVFLAPIAIPAYLFAGLTWKTAQDHPSAKILYYRELSWGRDQGCSESCQNFERKAA